MVSPPQATRHEMDRAKLAKRMLCMIDATAGLVPATCAMNSARSELTPGGEVAPFPSPQCGTRLASDHDASARGSPCRHAFGLRARPQFAKRTTLHGEAMRRPPRDPCVLQQRRPRVIDFYAHMRRPPRDPCVLQSLRHRDGGSMGLKRNVHVSSTLAQRASGTHFGTRHDTSAMFSVLCCWMPGS